MFVLPILLLCKKKKMIQHDMCKASPQFFSPLDLLFGMDMTRTTKNQSEHLFSVKDHCITISEASVK